MQRYAEKLLKFAHFADDLAQLSTCTRLRVGAVVFPTDCSAVYAIGYNGPPIALPNDSCTGEPGECGCVHAEVNALLKFDPHVRRPCVMYCTNRPCLPCARAILNVPVIRGFIWRNQYRTHHGIDLLENSGGLSMMSVGLLESGKADDLTLRHWRSLSTKVVEHVL